MSNWVQNKKLNYNKYLDRLKECEYTRQFTNYGQNIKDLEEFLFKKLKIEEDKSLICVVNATAGLHLLTNLFNNDKQWATGCFNFPSACIGPLKDTKIYDIDNEGGIDLTKTNGENLIITNLFGYLLDIPKYEKYCRDNNSVLILDNSATPYSFINNRNSLNFGNASVVSFHHTKLLGFSEGGCIIVPKRLEKKARQLICFGFDENRNYNKNGNNYKMNELSASAILTFLEEHFNKLLLHSRHLYLESKKIKYNQLYTYSDNIYPNCICFVNEKFTKEYITKMKDENIEVMKYYKPLANNKNSKKLYNKILLYPSHLDIDKLFFI